MTPSAELPALYPGTLRNIIRHMRPEADEKAVWNRRLGRPDSRPDAKSPYNTVVAYDETLASD